MMTLVIFSIGKNSNIDDEEGGRAKIPFFVDVICERSLTNTERICPTTTTKKENLLFISAPPGILAMNIKGVFFIQDTRSVIEQIYQFLSWIDFSEEK